MKHKLFELHIKNIEHVDIEKAFKVINDIEKYPKFLRFCKNIKILSSKTSYANCIDYTEALVSISYASFSTNYVCTIITNKQKFQTEIYIKDDRFEIFEACWKLEKITSLETEINFYTLCIISQNSWFIRNIFSKLAKLCIKSTIASFKREFSH